jgi:pimeloyl-ACP methyl ester carboxylesterase
VTAARRRRSAAGGRGAHPRLLVAATVLLLVLTGAACGAQKAALHLSPCTVQGIPARCGTLTVAEDRLSGQGRRIGLRVVVVPAEAPHPRPDPIVYLAGGPGDAATAHVQDMVAVRGLRDRDLVFVDQRGTGGSHRLSCPSPPSGAGSEDAGPLGRSLWSCLEHLDGDPRFYTTALAADDVGAGAHAGHGSRPRRRRG